MRPPHFIKPNHRTALPSSCIWVDTETQAVPQPDGSEHHVLSFGWAVHRRRIKGLRWSPPEWFRFDTRQEFWDWALAKTSKGKRTYIFAHNWGFDAPVLGAFSVLPARGWQPYKAILDGPPVWIPFRLPEPVPHVWTRVVDRMKKKRRPKVQRSLVLMDTLNIWRMPLERVGSSIGLPKLKMPSPDASQTVWDLYGLRDVEIIERAVLEWCRFLVEHDLGNFSMTLAAQAFAAYRHRFMPVKIFCDSKPKALELAREALHGGRTECFRLGEHTGPLYLVDVNSLYPAMMARFPYPTKLRGVYKHLTIDKLVDLEQDNSLCCRCEIETDEPVYGVVHDTRLVFPTGKLVTTLCTPELVYAIAKGHLKRPLATAVYTQDLIFREYVEYFWKMRQDAERSENDVLAEQCKLMLNSLYGKFGQRGRHWEDAGEAEDDVALTWRQVNADTGEQKRYRKFAGLLQELTDTGESFNSHPSIAAHVTAYGRMHMWCLIQRAGIHNVYYMDTDSLLLNAVGFEKLEDEISYNKLGRLKLERAVDRAELRGVKDYTLDDVTKVKGVRKDAIWEARDKVRQTQFTGLKGLLASGQVDAPVVRQITKHLSRDYKKGFVQQDGTVLPLNLTQW